MSSISFKSPTGSALLSGSERAYLSVLVDRIGFGVLDVDHNRHELAEALVGRHEQTLKHDIDRAGWVSSFMALMRWGDNDELRAGDDVVSTFHLNLNTALTLGSDALRLGARLHAQCEIHAWVDGSNRLWLADIIEVGRASGLYRSDMGWEEVAAFLRSSVEEPVVTSYSVTDGFPEPGPDSTYDESWWDKPATEQWTEGMAWLRAEDRGLELRPDHWVNYRFGKGMNGLQFMERLRATGQADHQAVQA